MVADRHRDTPPGKHGIHGGCQQPGPKHIPYFFGFLIPLFGCEKAGNAGKIDSAECQRQNSGPMYTSKTQVTQ